MFKRVHQVWPKWKKTTTIIPAYEDNSNSHFELLFRMRKYSKQLYVLYYLIPE